MNLKVLTAAISLGLASAMPVLAQPTDSGSAANQGQSENRDWGWLGLVGLVGLAGLMRRRPEDQTGYGPTTRNPTR